jgi:hypothetical protein
MLGIERAIQKPDRQISENNRPFRNSANNYSILSAELSDS